MRRTGLVAAAAALHLAGCAGISQSECEYSDWRAVGYEDGSQGLAAESFGRYRKSCAEHGVTPEFAAYQAGREAGLREYCQPSRAYQEGREGRAYAGVCPADTEPPFLVAYHEGRVLHDLESELRQAVRRIGEHEARIRQIEVELTDNATAALAATSTREERARLLVETKQLAEERGTLRAAIKDLEKERARLEKELVAAREETLAKR